MNNKSNPEMDSTILTEKGECKMNEENKVVKLSSPWMIYYRQIKALFSQDPNVKVIFDEENFTVKIYVTGGSKA